MDVEDKERFQKRCRAGKHHLLPRRQGHLLVCEYCDFSRLMKKKEIAAMAAADYIELERARERAKPVKAYVKKMMKEKEAKASLD